MISLKIDEMKILVSSSFFLKISITLGSKRTGVKYSQMIWGLHGPKYISSHKATLTMLEKACPMERPLSSDLVDS